MAGIFKNNIIFISIVVSNYFNSFNKKIYINIFWFDKIKGFKRFPSKLQYRKMNLSGWKCRLLFSWI